MMRAINYRTIYCHAQLLQYTLAIILLEGLLFDVTIFNAAASEDNRFQSRRNSTRVRGQDTRESISTIMDWTGTDKLFRHAYDRYYSRYFEEFRDKPGLRILEIGAATGHSLKVHYIESRKEK